MKRIKKKAEKNLLCVCVFFPLEWSNVSVYRLCDIICVWVSFRVCVGIMSVCESILRVTVVERKAWE